MGSRSGDSYTLKELLKVLSFQETQTRLSLQQQSPVAPPNQHPLVTEMFGELYFREIITPATSPSSSTSHHHHPFPSVLINTCPIKDSSGPCSGYLSMWVCIGLEATHMRVLGLQGRAMVENTTITKPGRKGDVEVDVELETPDLEGEVKSTVLDGSTIPTAL
nr:hypothetical protein Iba_chr11fCG10520 [Ipomoea batatas]GME01013.1 hypothetical protein Iba_scaffold56420CG0070 [Ipomoea batatas]